MPISTRLYTELRFTISDYVQREDWARLFEVCGTDDPEVSRAIAVICTVYDPTTIWKFTDYVAELSQEERALHENSIATASYILGKMGQDNVKKTLALLRLFLTENHSMRLPVAAALSNLWVLNPKATAKVILDSWVLTNDGNKDLQELGVRSSEFLAAKDPKSVAKFLHKVSKVEEQKICARVARELIAKYVARESLPKSNKEKARRRRLMKRRKKQKKQRRKRKEDKHKKRRQ
ncbi:MAG: hypothetical protein ACRDF4_08010 [Rhabdochlamydiaceae bacterium]